MARKSNENESALCRQVDAINAVLDVLNHSQTTLHHSISGANRRGFGPACGTGFSKRLNEAESKNRSKLDGWKSIATRGTVQ
jgi:hypothetical protein